MGRKAIDLTGQKFGSLTVKERDISVSKNAKWVCVCDCGNISLVESQKLRKGKTKSCGCKSALYKIETMGTHGKTNTKIYKIWHSMISRCEYDSPNIKSQKRYKDKGIRVCDEWRNNFEEFYSWSINNGYKDGLSIDRISNDGNYEPSNCRWVTKIEQDNNRSSNVNIKIGDTTHTIAEWSRISGVSYETIRSRIKAGKTGNELIRKNS